MTETYSVQTLRDYLLGQLPESESERLDELSITDDECAERIRAVEHDLIDAFARGELEGAVLEQFRSRYLTTPQGRDATRFAGALQSLDDENSEWGSSSEAGRGRTTRVREPRRWRELLAIAAAVILAAASVWVVLDNRMLRERVTSVEIERDRQLREAEARRATDTAPPPTSREPSPLTIATLVLAPQLRSARQLPTVALAGTGDLAVQLDLEPVDYPAYEATLVAANGDRVLWRSDRLIARTVGDLKRIDLGLPARVLSPQEYLIRVSGVPARGAPEIVGEYRFIVAR